MVEEMENISTTSSAASGYGNGAVQLYSRELGYPIITLQKFTLFRHFNRWIVFLISLTGTITNSINVRTFLSMGLEDNVTVSFFALACSDFIVSALGLALPLNGLYEFFARTMNLKTTIPPIVFGFHFEVTRRIFVLITMLITTYIAVQRCLCVLIPFRVKSLFTRFSTTVYLTSVLAFSVVCHSLYVWRYHLTESYNEAINTTQLILRLKPGSTAYVALVEVFLGVFLNMSCQLTLMLCLGVMFHTLRKSSRLRKSMTSEVRAGGRDVSTSQSDSTRVRATTSSNSKESQALKQVTLISTIFISMNSPYFAFGIFKLAVPDFGYGKASNYLYRMIVNIMMAAENFNSAVNFFVYYNFNSKFKKSLPTIQR